MDPQLQALIDLTRKIDAAESRLSRMRRELYARLARMHPDLLPEYARETGQTPTLPTHQDQAKANRAAGLC